jgi:NPCBM/NEW2 domain
MNSSPRRWGLEKWAAIATILGLIVAIYFGVSGGGDHEPEASPSSVAPGATPESTSSADAAEPPSSNAIAPAASATRYLSNQQYPADGQEIPYFAGYVEAGGSQDINGQQFIRNLNFPLVCSDTSDKFADYNLGRHFERFTATIGPSDISKSTGYHFEIWKDDKRVFSETLRHGQSKRINMSVRDVLKLRIAACSPDESVILEREGGGIVGDPQVTGSADMVPPSTTT